MRPSKPRSRAMAFDHALDVVDEALLDPHHEVRDAAQVREGLARHLGDGVHGEPRHRLAGELARQRVGEGERLLLERRAARVGVGEERARGLADPPQRLGERRVGLRPRHGATLLKAPGAAARLGFRDRGLGLGRGRTPGGERNRDRRRIFRSSSASLVNPLAQHRDRL